MASEMNGKTVIITGGASGIGLATGKALASMGAHVVAVGRNPEKGKKAVAAIKASAGHERVEFILCDLSSLEQVRTLAGDVIARIPRLDVLVNNAGLLLPDRCESADGIDMVLAVNHLAPFLLTHLLLDKLKAGAPARIVNVSTGGHSMATINFDDLQSTKRYSIIGDKPHSTFSLVPGFRTRNAGARGRCHHQYHVTLRHLRGGATQCPGLWLWHCKGRPESYDAKCCAI
jgi:NAD(P)-dependent dehydrogenase (short-subunit alcohol dehydrogenase family)